MQHAQLLRALPARRQQHCLRGTTPTVPACCDLVPEQASSTAGASHSISSAHVRPPAASHCQHLPSCRPGQAGPVLAARENL